MSDKVEALYYEPKQDGTIQCLLCPRGCVIGPGKAGACQGRRNEGGTLYAVNYGRTVSVAVDPIEKKPLYHFYPGKPILSIAPNGCNLACAHCQNWEISQCEVPTRELTSEQVVEATRQAQAIGVAYTYTEPLIWYEYILDTGALLREAGFVNVLVTNGYINEEPLRQLLPLIDAMNIDVKSIEDSFYREQCKGRVEPVLRTARMAKESGCHVEITNLIIPTLNDDEETVDGLIDWVAELGVDIPLHFSRYFPQYKCDCPPTPAETMQRAYERATQRLRYVYVGNISVPGASDTLCPQCRSLLVSRLGYATRIHDLEDGRCRRCGTPSGIVGL